MLSEKDLKTLLEGTLATEDWQSFMDSPIVALRNMTPRACLMCPEGQRILQGMLNELGLYKGMA